MNVYIVEDDSGVAEAIRFMLGRLKIDSRVFPTGGEFLDAVGHLQPGCVLLDLALPDTSGLGVQRELRVRDIGWPVVFMTGAAGVSSIVSALKQGAIDFLIKPFSDEVLLEALIA